MRAERVLVVSPHPDDEVLGAAGTLQKLKAAGAEIWVTYLCVDGFNHYGIDYKTTAAERYAEIDAVADLLGFGYDVVFDQQELTEKLDTVPQRDLVTWFEQKYNAFKPDLLFLPHGEDYDQDHRATFQAAFTAARPIPESLQKHLPPRVLTYESPKLAWAEHVFRPTCHWEIGAQLQTKLDAVALYKSQLREPPHIRSLENLRSLANLRGSEMGVDYAEAFQVWRWFAG